MKISLVTPEGKQSYSGNHTTAVRWARLLRSLGHKVKISEKDIGIGADMMIAFHAWRSADSILKFSELFPNKPLIILLTGTDITQYQYTHTNLTYSSMRCATLLVCLHKKVKEIIPKEFVQKLHVVLQSARPLKSLRSPSKRWFEAAVIGNLRDVKDPLRTAYAARLAPHSSRLRVVHLGKAYNPQWEKLAINEDLINPRYIWRREVAGWKVRRQLARSHLMVISSVAEGGANVVSEALVCGVPIIASYIDGNTALLGKNYTGYFPVKDETALANLLLRAENDPNFYKELSAYCQKRRLLFTEAAEQRALKLLFDQLGKTKP